MPIRSEKVETLIKHLSSLPGIGRRTAERLAFHILAAPEVEAMGLARSIEDVRRHIRRCSRCFNLAEAEQCSICADPSRDDTVLCVVEGARDVDNIESAGIFRGTYHVLGGQVSPLDGVEPTDLTIPQLARRAADSRVKEVIVATSFTVEGDATAHAVAEALDELPVKVTRPARGLTVGTAVQNANRAALADALEGRRDVRG
ncbi:MAG: recombination mediator RecR [Planctomycetota bacterium]